MGTVCSFIGNRLCNQISNIAAGLSFAKKYNKKFVISTPNYESKNSEAYTEYEYIISKFDSIREEDASNFSFIVESSDQHIVNLEEYANCENVAFKGVFTSDVYYDKQLVREFFGVSEDDKKRIFEKYGDLSDYVSISVRRGDYLNYSSIFVLPNKNWFKKCYLKYFKGKNVLVTSDDLEWCKQNLKFNGVDVIYLNEPNDVETFKIKQCCKNHIIPPSTYSWWSAYLSGDDSIVVAPDIWYQKNSGILSEPKYVKGWIKEPLELSVALCCIGRMENRYIKEYIDYYKNIGVDKIFLYDNNYDGEEHFEDAIGDYINDGFVEVIDFRNQKVCQLKAYQDCYDKYGGKYDWICFFDIDEYLTFRNEEFNIKDFLSMGCFDNYDMIHVNWKVYGDNDLVHYEEKPLTERFSKPIMPLNFKCGYDFPENNHVKSIVRGGSDVKWTSTPHTPIGNVRCCNSAGYNCLSTSPFCRYDFSVAWLNHYQTKTIEEWMEVKSRRGFPDQSTEPLKETKDAIKQFFKRNKVTEEKNNFLQKYIKLESIILSMTTIPIRKDRLIENLPAILKQSYNFDKLVINIDDNLSDEDYRWYEGLKTIDNRIEVNKSEAKWRSCNKLLPTLQKYPEDVIITLDDDIFYPVDTIKFLVEWHKKNPDCIIAHEINPITISGDFEYVGYENAYDVKLMQKEWGKYLSNCCLFPPHTFDNSDLYDYDKMFECTNGTHDELWFWVNSTINGVMSIGLNYVRSFAPEMLRKFSDGEYRLTDFNDEEDKIKGYMKKINSIYGELLLKQIKSKKVEFVVTKDNYYSFLFLWPYIKSNYDYGFDLTLRGLTKDWTNRLMNIIKNKAKSGI